MNLRRYFKDATFNAVRLIGPVTQKHNPTLIEIVLRWYTDHSALRMQKGGRDGVIVGVSSFAQLGSDLKNLEKGPLSDDVRNTLDEAWLMTKPATPN